MELLPSLPTPICWRGLSTEQGEDVSSVYHLLALHYDSRLTALDAKKQLNSYRIPRGTNLADGISHILDLATRVSTSVPTGPTRVALYNLEAVED